MASNENTNSGSTQSASGASTQQAPSSGGLQTPFVMHNDRAKMAIVVFVVGPIAAFVGLKLGLAIAGGASVPTGTISTVVILMTLLMAVLMMSTDKRFVIQSNEVQIIGPFGRVTRRSPIQGIGDLYVDGKIVRRRSDGKRVALLSKFDCNANDVATLKAALPSK